MAYFATGYAFSFGGGNGFCGTKYFFLIGLPDDRLAHCFFQFTFAATATTIVKGTIHERCTMTAYVCYSLLISGKLFKLKIQLIQLNCVTLHFITGFLYPIASHWIEEDMGWYFFFYCLFIKVKDYLFTSRLHQWGFEDFAGSCMVHSLGGVASLVASYMAGPRHNLYKEGIKQNIPSHSAPVNPFLKLLSNVISIN